MATRMIDQVVNIGGITFWVEGHINTDGEFYGDIHARSLVTGEDERQYTAYEQYSVGMKRGRYYYEFHLIRPTIAGGDEVYKKFYDTYNEMRQGKHLLESIIMRIR